MAVAELHGRVMGCRLQLIGVDADPRLLHRARARLEELECRWTRFSPGSDISRLNQRAAGRPVAVTVEPDTVTLLQRMIEGWRATDGRYNPTILRRLVDSGYSASRTDPSRVTALPPWAGTEMALDGIEVDVERCLVTLPSGMVLDAGGIGKGLAADLTVSWLLEAGAGGALVSIGGDLAMAGSTPTDDGWIIDVEHPDPSDGVLCSLAVAGGGVATSSTVSRTWSTAGSTHHHVIDPLSGGESTTDLAAVTVLAPTAWQAEVFATSALLLGSDGAVDELERHGFDGLAVTRLGDVVCTYDLRELDRRTEAGAR